MIKFYTQPNCGQCIGLKMQMDKKGIEYEVIQDEEIVKSVADKNGIFGIPFAEVVMDTPTLIAWVRSQEGK